MASTSAADGTFDAEVLEIGADGTFDAAGGEEVPFASSMLEPGHYVVECESLGADGTPYAMQGMLELLAGGGVRGALSDGPIHEDAPETHWGATGEIEFVLLYDGQAPYRYSLAAGACASGGLSISGPWRLQAPHGDEPCNHGTCSGAFTRMTAQQLDLLNTMAAGEGVAAEEAAGRGEHGSAAAPAEGTYSESIFTGADPNASVAVLLGTLGLDEDVLPLLEVAGLGMTLRSFRQPGRALMQEMVGDALGAGREAEVGVIIEAAFGEPEIAAVF